MEEIKKKLMPDGQNEKKNLIPHGRSEKRKTNLAYGQNEKKIWCQMDEMKKN